VRIALTTCLHPSPAEAAAARAAAARWELPFVERGKRPLERLRDEVAVDGLLVLTSKSACLLLPPPHPSLSHEEPGERVHTSAERGIAWSPGMGALRAKRVERQLAGDASREGSGRDPFFEAAGIRPGDAVLDCTLGLGADALVASVAAGPSGRVVGVEGSAALAAWVGEGLARSALPAAARIEVRSGDHATLLASLPERSFDVVCFDPMFRHARAEPGGFDRIRALADSRPLAAEALALAQRVARRWVLVKDGAPGWDLARLGLTPLPSARGAHRYFARLPAG
jgi:16S rRNA (guanine1516-N2)-methyltransferase